MNSIKLNDILRLDNINNVKIRFNFADIYKFKLEWQQPQHLIE